MRTTSLPGWLALALALVSPLCNLGVALFSARVAQHVAIALVAAPLLVAGRADLAVWRGLTGRDAPVGRTEMVLAPILYAAVLWAWHAPALYDATLRDNAVYWTMHVTNLLAALALWRAILRAPTPGARVAVSFATGMQMGLLGAGLTLLPRALYAVHFGTTAPWGLSPLEDQQLGGLVMWVPGGVLLTVHAVLALSVTLRRMERANADA
nr:cytochrome c oxidase assembly protein [Alsobacter ponti]